MKVKVKGKRILWILLVAIIVVAVALAGGRLVQQRVQADADPEASQIVTASISDLSTRVSASGQLLPQKEARLALGIRGQVEQVLVKVGDTVEAGDVLVRLESDNLERAVRSAEQTLAIQEANLAELVKEPDAKDVAAAEAATASAEALLDELLTGPSEKEVARAETALASAQAQLDDLLAGPSEKELAQAEAALASAQVALRAAEAHYEALDDQLVVAQNNIHTAQLGKDRARDQYNLLVWNDWKASVSWAPYSPQGAAVKQAQIDYDVAVANYNLTKINVNDSALRNAQTQVAQAEAALAALTEEKTVQIANARAQLAQAQATLAALTEEKTVQIAGARAQLAQAQARLQALLDATSDEQVAVARAQVEKARIALERARRSVGDVTLVAPFDGLVTKVRLQVGEWASGLAVELVDTNSLEVVLDADEVDMGTIAVGQPAAVTLEAWPDRELDGQVVSIAPKANSESGIVSYRVHLSIEAGELPVRTGMTANAGLVTANLHNVLLVPNRAIIADRKAGKYYVNQVQGKEIVQVEVTIGLRDNTYTEITSGLNAGDKLVIGEDKELDLMSGPPGGHGRIGR